MNKKFSFALPKLNSYKITLKKLLSFEDKKFIFYAYHFILGRAPDVDGFSYYLEEIHKGGKIHVLATLRKSPEAKLKRIKNRIFGLDWVIRFEHLFNSPPTQGFIQSITGLQLSSSRKFFKTASNNVQPALWFDITKIMHWTGGIVGIVRTEIEFASLLHKINPETRYLMLLNGCFVEVPATDLVWLLKRCNIADAYLEEINKYKNAGNTPLNELSYRFHYKQLPKLDKEDIILSVGFLDENKEPFFSILKRNNPAMKIIYLIYDIILIHPKTRHYYPYGCQLMFENYLEWASKNCNYLLFGGQTAYQDTIEYQKMKEWPSPPGLAIRLGADKETNIVNHLLDKPLLQEMGVCGRFILAVGSFEGRKNYQTLYRAYKLAQKISPNDLPQLVICGKSFLNPNNLLDMISRDPQVNKNIHVISATENQRKALYRNCLFTVLPSIYEGWSLTLPESLAYGKFCLASDTPPLREIGDALIDYIMPYDVRMWAEKIVFYSSHSQQLKLKETKIATEWKNTPWEHVVTHAYKLIQQIKQDGGSLDLMKNKKKTKASIMV